MAGPGPEGMFDEAAGRWRSGIPLGRPKASRSRAAGAAISIEIDEKSFERMRRVFKILAADDLPRLKSAMENVGERFASEVRTRAPGGIAGTVKDRGVRRSRAGQFHTLGVVAHPGARSMEFGRKWYWVGYTRPGKRFVGGRKTIHRPGQASRPYVGVIDGDQATGAVAGWARARITSAIQNTWTDITAAGPPAL
ncbi:MAG: hypothetical protein FJ318_06045 [SAR202 cluster bacterium]|nr:hypothetical protein [SAR202 cluster bacterium]